MNPATSSLKGKKAIITGANRSIGQKIATMLAQEGADIAISYRSDEAGAKKTIKQVEAYGQTAHAFYADFSSLDNVKHFFDQAIAALGHVDILINNAGMICREDTLDLDPQKLQTVFQINSITPFYLMQLAAENMISNNIKGNVIHISSNVTRLTFPTGIGYAASKAALNQMTKNAALNLAKHHIRVNTIAPGLIKAGVNENTETTNPEHWQGFLKTIPLGVPGEPTDVAELALFLASEKGRWITGKIFEVDGGGIL